MTNDRRKMTKETKYMVMIKISIDSPLDVEIQKRNCRR